MDRKYLLVNWEKYNDFENIKIKDFITELKKNNNVKFINDSNENIKKFIIENLEKDYLYIFPYIVYFWKNWEEYLTDMDNFATYIENIFLESKRIINSKFVFNSMDFTFCNFKEKYNRTLCYSKNINIIFNYENLIYLKNFYPDEFSKLKNNNLHFCGIHYSYLILPTNLNPINKVCLAGQKGEDYPERYRFDKLMSNKPHKYQCLKNIVEKPSDFIKRMNNYICVFFSSHLSHYNSCCVHKIFEILGSGSLLLTHYKDSKVMSMLGLRKNVHYMMIEKNESTEKKVDFILDKKNRTYIDKIRTKGKKYAKRNLNYKFLYNKMINIFDTIHKKNNIS